MARWTVIAIFQLCFLALFSPGFCSRLKERQTEEDYLNMCLKGTNHKTKPGPEAKLYKQCLPWQSRSCCTKEISDDINHKKNFLNFNWHHCNELSTACRQHFIQDLCFYECEPNVGPWLVEDVRQIRDERYMDVPLCQTECLGWWNACQNDLTCVENWSASFNWSTGINTCPSESECKPFKEVYSGAQDFCENVFGHSYKVVPDSPGECFRLWFDADHPNPNQAVAKKKIAELLGHNSSSSLKPLVIHLAFLGFLFFCF